MEQIATDDTHDPDGDRRVEQAYELIAQMEREIEALRGKGVDISKDPALLLFDANACRKNPHILDSLRTLVSTLKTAEAAAEGADAQSMAELLKEKIVECVGHCFGRKPQPLVDPKIETELRKLSNNLLKDAVDAPIGELGWMGGRNPTLPSLLEDSRETFPLPSAFSYRNKNVT